MSDWTDIKSLGFTVGLWYLNDNTICVDNFDPTMGTIDVAVMGSGAYFDEDDDQHTISEEEQEANLKLLANAQNLLSILRMVRFNLHDPRVSRGDLIALIDCEANKAFGLNP